MHTHCFAFKEKEKKKKHFTCCINSQKFKFDICKINQTYVGVSVLQLSLMFIGTDHLFSTYFPFTQLLMSLVAIAK